VTPLQGELVELDDRKDEYASRGINVTAISHDPVEPLKAFSDRVDLGFPLLADPDSRIIGEFGIINTGVPEDSPHYGFAYAGYYLVDADGVVPRSSSTRRTTTAPPRRTSWCAGSMPTAAS
jgi:peroxiredoxin